MDKEKSFQSIPTVVKFLQHDGWKVSRAAAYYHLNEGKIRPQKDGTFLCKDVLRYARRWLKRKDVGYLIHLKACEWINLVDGDATKKEDLIRAMKEALISKDQR